MWIVIAFLSTTIGFTLLRIKRGAFSGRVVILSIFGMLIYSFFDTSLDISRTVVEGSFTFSPAAILNEIAAPVIWFIVLWGAILLKNSSRKDRPKPKDIGVFEQSQNEFWNVPCNGLVSNYAYKGSVFVYYW